MRRILTLALSAILVVAFAAPALATQPGDHGSPIVPAHVYVDGETFGTIVLGELPYNGNDQSFDELYVIMNAGGGEAQGPIAEYAPGDPEYNGGRWITTVFEWAPEATPTVLTSFAEVHAAEMAGDLLEVGAGPVFLCPLIPNH